MANIVIPRVDLRVQHAAMREEILRAVADVLDSGTLILGPQVRAFEQEMAEYLGPPGHAVAVGNGTDALAIALRALGIGPGDEVLTVANTAVPTASAIRMAGAVPTFCDIDPETLMLDPADARRRITRRTRAVVPVHLFGNAVDMTRVLALAHEYHLKVVEDCAQSCGTRYMGQMTGTLGDIGCYSFYPTKNLAACGDGGLCYTRDDVLADAMRQIRMYGCDPHGHARRAGVNSRLDELQAAILRVKLRHLPAALAARQRIAERYDRGLPPSCVAVRTTEGAVHSHCLYVLRLPSRPGVTRRLAEAGIECAVHYPMPIHEMDAFRPLHGAPAALPHTERAAGEILSLPCYPGMIDEHVQRVIEVLRGAC